MPQIDSAVVVRDLSVRFGDFTAVNKISFSVQKGEIFGFLGANGAGKTTTIRVLCGLLIPSEGDAEVGGFSVTKSPDDVKKTVGYMSQKFTLYPDLTVQENLDFTASLRKIPSETLKTRTKTLFDFIGFKRPPSTLVRDLPGGFKQEVSLAAAMLHDPAIIFLDEPTAGVAPAVRARFWALIRKLSDAGKTIFVTTHYMDEAEECDRIALMRGGQLIALDSAMHLKKKSFPEPLFEIEANEAAPANWLEALRKSDATKTLQPYGLRYHVTVKDDERWQRFLASQLGRITTRAIQPSLEDVFIRLVEGADR